MTINEIRLQWQCLEGTLWLQVFIAGELLFDRSTPASMNHHLPWFTTALLALQFITFAYMAGKYPARRRTLLRCSSFTLICLWAQQCDHKDPCWPYN